MPTIEDGIREYNKAISCMDTPREHYENAKKILESCKKNYPHTMDIGLIDKILTDIDKKLSAIQL